MATEFKNSSDFSENCAAILSMKRRLVSSIVFFLIFLLNCNDFYITFDKLLRNYLMIADIAPSSDMLHPIALMQYIMIIVLLFHMPNYMHFQNIIKIPEVDSIFDNKYPNYRTLQNNFQHPKVSNFHYGM